MTDHDTPPAAPGDGSGHRRRRFKTSHIVLAVLALVAGTWLARMPGRGRRIAHGHVMAWSYGGLVAAGAGQGATALGLAPWPAILACLALTGLALWRADLGAMLGAR